MNDDIAIRVDGVYKNFRLPHEKNNSLKSLLVAAGKKKNKGYEVQHALKNISFETRKGEFFGIVGRNGSGKSTLLKIIASIYQPTNGRVSVNGRLVPFIELGVGFNPELTGRENVYLNGALMGFSKSEINTKYASIVEFAELDRFMDQKLKNYSSGMQVRLAFSVATILAESDILLIDEVLAVGDADFQRKCFNYFKQLKKDKKTVIFVSHDMEAIREYCDRAILIEKNEIIKEGPSDDVARTYTKLFIGIEENKEDDATAEKRWGLGGIKTQKIETKVTQKDVRIKHTIIADRDMDSPIVGIRIRSVSGENVTGTNTKIEKLKLGAFHKFEKRVLEWSFPNMLADGDFYIEPSIVAEDGVTVFDWWDEASRIRIKKERTLPYVADPGFNVVKIEK